MPRRGICLGSVSTHSQLLFALISRSLRYSCINGDIRVCPYNYRERKYSTLHINPWASFSKCECLCLGGVTNLLANHTGLPPPVQMSLLIPPLDPLWDIAAVNRVWAPRRRYARTAIVVSTVLLIQKTLVSVCSSWRLFLVSSLFRIYSVITPKFALRWSDTSIVILTAMLKVAYCQTCGYFISQNALFLCLLVLEKMIETYN